VDGERVDIRGLECGSFRTSIKGKDVPIPRAKRGARPGTGRVPLESQGKKYEEVRGPCPRKAFYVQGFWMIGKNKMRETDLVR